MNDFTEDSEFDNSVSAQLFRAVMSQPEGKRCDEIYRQVGNALNQVPTSEVRNFRDNLLAAGHTVEDPLMKPLFEMIEGQLALREIAKSA
jgi:hypothetical protein